MKVVIDSGRCIVKRLPKGFFIKQSLLAKTRLAFRLSGDNFQHASNRDSHSLDAAFAPSRPRYDHDAGILAL